MVSQLGRTCLIFFALTIAATTAAAQSFVYALESGTLAGSCIAGGCHGPTIHLINAATGHQLASYSVGGSNEKGTSLRLSSDGRLLFVTTTLQPTGGSPGRLYVIDAIARTTLAQVDVGADPSDVAVLPDTSRAYVVNNHGDSVSIVDLTSFTVTATIPVQHFPWRIAVSPGGTAVYVTNAGSSSVSKISTTTDAVETTFGVGPAPLGLDMSPDGSRLFVANSGNATITVIDAALDSVLRVVPAGSTANPPIDVSAQSATRLFVALDDPNWASLGPNHSGRVELLNSADGAILGSTSIQGGGRLARDASGAATYVAERLALTSARLRSVFADGTASALPAQATSWDAITVLTDPCAFEATASTTTFTLAGGSGTLTIPAPAGCSWTIDTTRVQGLTVAAPLSGTGPATRAFTVAAASTVRLGFLDIGRQALQVEQTFPRMNLDFAPGSATLQQPFAVNGWAVDEHVITDTSTTPDTGIDVVTVYAYPASGAPPVFVGFATYGLPRADLAAFLGPKYQPSGFSIVVGALPSGVYTLVFYGHSTRSGTFSAVQAVNVTVRQAQPVIVIDSPSSQVANRTPVQVSGWAVDPAASSGAGVDAVHIYAYPESGAPPIFLGAAVTGFFRLDVAAYLGARFTQSGFSLPAVSLLPGAYTLVVYARSTATGQFFAQTQRMTIAPSAPRINIDTPPTTPPAAVPPGGIDPGTQVSNPFSISGWALDLASSTETGVDVVQAWAYPVSGAAPIFAGTATTVARPDVAAYVGPQFLNSGFQIGGVTLPPGTYTLVVFAHSTVTRAFSITKVVRITVQ